MSLLKKSTTFIAFFSVCCLPEVLFGNNSEKIVYLVSGPRSVSTAFLRMMEARGDFVIFNEPSEYAYSSTLYPDYANRWFDEGKKPLPTFEAVKQKLLETAKTSPVFVKEMSDVSYHFLKEDDELLKNPNVRFLFLVRDPHEIAMSYYKKDISAVEHMDTFIGSKNLYDVFKMVLEKSPNKPGIIFTDKLTQDPATLSHNLEKHLGIPHKAEALSWTPHDNPQEGSKHWHEVKKEDEVLNWHDRALKSSGFEQLTTYDRDANGDMTFSEISDETVRRTLKEAADIHAIYFNEMKEYTDYHI